MIKKLKCRNCGEEAEIRTDESEDRLHNILCKTCATGSKEEVDKRARK